MSEEKDTIQKKKKFQNQFIFEYLRNILHDKSEETLEKHLEDKESMKSFPSVVIFRYLSMCQNEKIRDFISKNQISLERLDKLGHDKTYRYLFDNIPKTNITYIKYIK